MADFSDIIGQNQMKEHMQNALSTGKVSHAYIISGENGSGKEYIAKTFAKALQCQHRSEKGDYEEACNECPSCIKAESDSHPDIITIGHEKPNSIGVDDIRLKLRDDVIIKPYESDYKIYIIPEGEKMTVAAQNALLKTLEEPPSYIVIIILTNNLNAFLPTIISRCIVLPVKPVRDDMIRKFLMEEKRVVDYKAAICASFARGNVGKALDLASNEDFINLKDSAVELISKIDNLEIHSMMDRVHLLLEPPKEEEEDEEEDEEKPKKKRKAKDNGADTDKEKTKTASKAAAGSALENFFDILYFLYRDILVYKATEDDAHLIFTDKLSYIRSAIKKYTYEDVNTIIKSLETARNRIRANVNTDLTLELMLLDIKEAGHIR
jgi:DNA polymerase-3 subunit delta'